jgi:hypothetical protein
MNSHPSFMNDESLPSILLFFVLLLGMGLIGGALIGYVIVSAMLSLF